MPGGVQTFSVIDSQSEWGFRILAVIEQYIREGLC